MDTVEFLATVHNIIQEDGEFISKGKAYHDEDAVSTAERAASVTGAREVSDDDVSAAEAALEWAQGMDPEDNDFLLKLNALSHREDISESHTGVLAAIFTAQERAEEAAEAAENLGHIGTEGERQTLEGLTVVSSKVVHSRYGPSTLYNFEDDDGNRAVWFTSSDAELPEGEPVDVVARVKDHGEYRGVPQTKLTHVKLADA